MPESKACRGCGETKPLADYAKKRKSHAARCKDCLRKWAAEYRREHGDTVNTNARTGYAIDPTGKRASKSAYWDRHRDTIVERRRLQYREQYAADPSPWRAAHSRRRQRIGKIGAADRVLSVAYRKAIRNDPCWYCGVRLPDDMHDDHYFPLSKGGTDHWWNLVRACGPCNRRKHAYCGTWFMLRRGTVEPPRSVPAVA